MPLQATSGTASYDAFGGGVAVEPVYIEQIFQTYLYTGNGSTQTITNGIDLSGKGGLVWMKGRSGATDNALYDTARGATFDLVSNGTTGQTTQSTGLTSFGSTGFSIGALAKLNTSAATYTSWTLRKQPKFFDIQTWTGNSTNRTISHALGSVPGCIMVKRTDTTSTWQVYHRSIANTDYLELNTTAGSALGANRWNSTTATSTVFSIGTAANVNASGGTYVAYIFAHDAGGFGLTGTDNVISCGSYTGNGSATGPVVTLGYEPQWLMIKRATGTANGNWVMLDVMRGFSTSTDNELYANLSIAEGSGLDLAEPQATGFQIKSGSSGVNANTDTYIYIAIRRGPMKVPTSGTSVFSPIVSSASAGTPITTGFPVDVQFPIYLDTSFTIPNVVDRLRSASSTTTPSGLFLDTSITNAEASGTVTRNWGNTGFDFPNYYVGARTLFLNFRRATGYFDEVCYTGTGSGSTQITHNLQAIPELVICKSRSSAINWSIACNVGGMNYVRGLASAFGFNSTNAATQTVDFTGVISSTYFKPTTIYGAADDANQSGVTYVAYLFATCAGVSKVGSYTGTATTKQVDCGFTGGARFVLIKRTDSTGGWYVWDSARGIVSGNDPYLLLNSAAAEVTTTDYIDTYSAGFEISSTAPAAINASGGTFIFLAIA